MTHFLMASYDADRSLGFSPRLWLSAVKPRTKLILAASLSVLVYFLAFVLPIHLYGWFELPRLDRRYLFWTRPAGQTILLVAFLLLWVLYLWGWRAARSARSRSAWIVVLGGALACALLLLFMAPFDSADIYDNILHGRILGIYGANPYTRVGTDFPNDPFFGYSAWKRSPSAYGPLWELQAGLSARLAGSGFLANLLAFKLASGLYWAGSLLLAALILRKLSPRHALSGVCLLAWNPMVLYSTWGNGHNDMAVVFWSLLALWLAIDSRFTLSVLALTAGVLTKYIPLLLLPAVAAYAWRSLPQTGKRWRFLLLTLIAALILTVLAYYPFWNGVQTLTIERRARLFSSSIPAVAYHILKGKIGAVSAAGWVSGVAAALTAVFILWRARRSGLASTSAALTAALFDSLTFFLLFTCLWFQQWYTVWLVGLAALLPPGYRQRLALFFSFAVLSKQFVIGPILFWPRPRLPQPGLEALFTLGVLGLPWLYLLLDRSVSRRMLEIHKKSLEWESISDVP